ncbi:hypothetical protein CLU79DRAFT_765983, partial [Phycomyces nitens]
FENEDDEYFTVPAVLSLGGAKMAEIGVEDGKLCVTVDELRENVFEPVVKQVLELISDQITQSKKRINTIFVVGGFGQSKYLGKRIKKTFAARVGSIAVPSRGEISVMRGAVMFGRDPGKVSHRVLRRTYGLRVSHTFNPFTDPPNKRYTAPDGETRCTDCFFVYGKKGTSVAMDSCVLRNLIAYYSHPLCLDLYAYDIDENVPRFVTDPGVRKVAIFNCELPFIPNVKTNEKLDFAANMYFGKTEIILKAIVNGHTYTFTSTFDSHELEKAAS